MAGGADRHGGRAPLSERTHEPRRIHSHQCRVGGGDVGAHGRPAARAHHDRLPADAAFERVVAQHHGPACPDTRAQQQLDARGLQAPGAGEERDPAARSHAQRHAAPAHVQAHAARDLRPLACQDLPQRQSALLERRDLGLVEDVADVYAAGRHPHHVEVVHREVAERMGVRGRRREQQECGRDQQHTPHPPSS